MKKVVGIFIILLIITSVVALLFYNKSKTKSKATSSMIYKDIPVKTAVVIKKKLGEGLNLVGTLYGNTEVAVLSETNGRIVRLFADFGDNIKKGSPIAQVDDELKRAAFSNAEAVFEKAKKDYERYEQLLKEKSANEAQFEAAKLAYKTSEAQLTIARRQLNDTKIISPISGTITSRNIEIGTVVNPGTLIVNIADISTLKLKINVAEKDVFKLKPGDLAGITTSVYPEIQFKGKIKSIGSRGDEAHTYPVEITLANNSAHPLKSGMFARVHFSTVNRDECAVIPRQALICGIKNPQVFILENSLARLRNITIGNDEGDELEVLNGLNPGDVIIISGQINLRDSINVIVIK